MAIERHDIERALRETGGKIGRAAKLLGASRRTLQARMRSYGMAPGKAGRPRRKLGYRGKRRLYTALGAAAVAGLGYLALRKPGSSA